MPASFCFNCNKVRANREAQPSTPLSGVTPSNETVRLTLVPSLQLAEGQAVLSCLKNPGLLCIFCSFWFWLIFKLFQHCKLIVFCCWQVTAASKRCRTVWGRGVGFNWDRLGFKPVFYLLHAVGKCFNFSKPSSRSLSIKLEVNNDYFCVCAYMKIRDFLSSIYLSI